MNRLDYLRGSLVAIVTPFDRSGNIDYQAYERLIEMHLEKGTNGIVVAGTTGESSALTEDEYVYLIRFTVEKVNGEIPVIAGAGSNVTQKAVHHSRLAKREGADGLLILNPYYNKPTEEGIFMHFQTIAENVDLPIILYNVPGRTGSNMSASLTLRLAEAIPSIIGIKEASGDLNQIMEIINKRPAGFKVFSGDDAMTLSLIAAGADGCISVVANQVPDLFSRMINALLEGDLQTGRTLHYQLLHLMNLNFMESNPIPVKTALAMMGYINENFRAPIYPMTNKVNRAKLLKALQELDLIKASEKEEVVS